MNTKKNKRMCIVCRKVFDKNQLLKIVKTENSYDLDLSNKINGRSAYICNNADCIKLCLKQKSLNRSFKCNVPSSIYEKLGEHNIG